ncbi:MAG: cupin-like domain-containing protein [Acidobacteria bacterium]|nr:cupin-like domain-containing protein [Acidobacteriota bacterium]
MKAYNHDGLTNGTLARLLAPAGLGRFLRESFGKEPVLLRGEAGRVEGLISGERVAAAMLRREREQGRFMVGALDRALDGEEALRAYLDAGQPVMWNAARGATAALDALTEEMKEAFGASVWPNVYWTGSAVKPFEAHFDAHDVLAVQCEGEKEWLVSKLRVNCPLDTPAFAPAVRQALEERRAEALANAHMTVVTQPGDVLYIPRGQFHDARTPRGRSLHVTFAITPPTAMDVLAALALGEPLFREYLPPPLTDEDGSRTRAHLGRVAERFRQLAEGEDILHALGRAPERQSGKATRLRDAFSALLTAGRRVVAG